jgi:hypothetical protein
MYRDSPGASTSQFMPRPTAALQAYSRSMYQYTKSKMTVLLCSVPMPNQTSAPHDQKRSVEYDWKGVE